MFKKKTIYILVLFLLAVNFWTILPLGYYINNDVNLVLTLLWLAYGYKKFGSKKIQNSLYKKKYKNISLWIYVATILSFLPAYLFHNQSILISMIASRTMIYYISIPVLLAIKPSNKEIIKALEIYSIIYLIVFFADAWMPFPITYSRMYWESQSLMGVINNEYFDRGGFGATLNGYILITIPLYYRIQCMIRKFEIKDLYWSAFLFSIIFVVQNRSTLFVAALIFIYGIIKIKHKYKPILVLILSILIVCMLSYTSDYWMNMFNETISQAGDNDYNRVKAFNYFFYKASPNWVCYIFGNGFLSAHTTDLMQEMMNKGVYNSDVGFVGVWNQYGIIPIIIFVIYIIKAFINKRIPFYVKAIALHILACSLTISYFVGNCVWFFLFIYLYAYYNERQDQIG